MSLQKYPAPPITSEFHFRSETIQEQVNCSGLKRAYAGLIHGWYIRNQGNTGYALNIEIFTLDILAVVPNDVIID